MSISLSAVKDPITMRDERDHYVAKATRLADELNETLDTLQAIGVEATSVIGPIRHDGLMTPTERVRLVLHFIRSTPA